MKLWVQFDTDRLKLTNAKLDELIRYTEGLYTGMALRELKARREQEERDHGQGQVEVRSQDRP